MLMFLTWGKAMRRRDFIARVAGAAAGSPLAALAQQTRVWRVGYISPAFPPQHDPAQATVFAAFRQRMKELGYSEGKNLVVEER